MVIKLSKPVTVGDKTVEEVKLDLDSVTGADIMFCVNEATAARGVVVHYRTDVEVSLQLAAKLTGIGRAELLKLKGSDFNKIMAPVQSFFLETE